MMVVNISCIPCPISAHAIRFSSKVAILRYHLIIIMLLTIVSSCFPAAKRTIHYLVLLVCMRVLVWICVCNFVFLMHNCSLLDFSKFLFCLRFTISEFCVFFVQSLCSPFFLSSFKICNANNCPSNERSASWRNLESVNMYSSIYRLQICPFPLSNDWVSVYVYVCGAWAKNVNQTCVHNNTLEYGWHEFHQFAFVGCALPFPDIKKKANTSHSLGLVGAESGQVD